MTSPCRRIVTRPRGRESFAVSASADSTGSNGRNCKRLPTPNTIGVVKKRGRKNPSPGPDRDGDAIDADLFAREMVDVARLGPDPRGRVRTAPQISAPRETVPPAGNVSGSHEDFTAPGVDRREIRKLKRGEYDIADRLDLHGLTAVEACTSVGRFIEKNRHGRRRCVCIVHGRGLHSEEHASVLKPRVRTYLTSHRSVLAFADAPRSDGGAGAVYVLLRK